MRLTFIQLAPFVADWRRLKLTDGDLVALEAALIDHPEAGPVMAGTGGVRKVRFAPPSWHTGKRGAARVCYVHFPGFAAVYLVAAFGKNEKPNLTPAERKALAALMPRLHRALGAAAAAAGGRGREERPG